MPLIGIYRLEPGFCNGGIIPVLGTLHLEEMVTSKLTSQELYD